MIKLIIWDFNGTLLDDSELCRSVLNDMLARRGIKAVSRDSYAEIFRFPVIDYYKLAGFDFEKEPFDVLAREFIGLYEKGFPADGLRDGAFEAFGRLGETGICQILLSATETSQLVRYVQMLGITGCFSKLIGSDNIYAGGKAQLAANWLASSGFSPGETVFIGDTAHDFEVARQLGCACVLITGGHYSKKRLHATGAPVFENLSEVCGYIISTLGISPFFSE